MKRTLLAGSRIGVMLIVSAIARGGDCSLIPDPVPNDSFNPAAWSNVLASTTQFPESPAEIRSAYATQLERGWNQRNKFMIIISVSSGYPDPDWNNPIDDEDGD